MENKESKLVVVLIPVNNFTNGRKIAKTMENKTFKNTAEVISEIHAKDNEEDNTESSTTVRIYEISDYMDACNNQEIELEDFWVSYAFIKKR